MTNKIPSGVLQSLTNMFNVNFFTYRWKNYIETEQNSVENLLATSFKALCKDTAMNAAVSGRQPMAAAGEDVTDGIGRYHRLRADSFSSVLSGRGRQSSGSGSSTATAITDLYSGLSPLPPGTNYPAAMMSRGGYSHHGTLPRSPATARLVQLRTGAAAAAAATASTTANGSEDACTNCGHHNSNSSVGQESLPGSPSLWQSRPAMTLPDDCSPPVRRQSFSSSSPLQQQPHWPPGMAELETMYNAMKNLNSPLPNAAPSVFAAGHNSGRMPAVYPLPLSAAVGSGQRLRSNSLEEDLRLLNGGMVVSGGGDNSDAASLAGCYDIPPPPPPVQSHAVLESGLGHELPPVPRTPGALRKLDWSLQRGPPNIPLPPLPPKRTSSRLSDMMAAAAGHNNNNSASRRTRPANLNLSHDSDSSSIYSRPRPFLHRSSLMSTGSSDSGSCSSGPTSSSSDPELQQLPMSPLTPSSELVFSWPNYAIGGGGSVSPTDHHHQHLPRSVSQIGCRTAGGGADPDCQSVGGGSSSGGGNNSANTSMTSHSGVYVKMHRLFSNPAEEEENPDSPYMNLLYAAIQRQGGTGSVETAMSPYLSMTGFETSAAGGPSSASCNVKNLRNAAIDSVSAIYAQIDSSSSRGSYEELAKTTSGAPPTASPSSKPTTTRRRESSSSSKSSKALAEFRELMLEVERKRNFRVGLNLFNTAPEMGVEYLVKQNFLELSPLAVARFLYVTHGLARAKVAAYLVGQPANAFCMKVLSCYLEQFDFGGLRLDKALRKLLTAVQVAGGEAQGVEKLLEVFGKRYLKCNPAMAAKMKNSSAADSIVTLAYATVLLNTDLHSPHLKAERRMTEKDFVANVRGAEGGQDFDSKLLKSIYKAVKKQAFVSAGDHVTQAQLLQASMVGNKTSPPALAEPHRRLVCLCRLADVLDINTKKEAEAHAHARDIWLFNDMLIVTKIVAGRTSAATRGGPVYAYRDSFPLRGTEVTLFHTPVYRYGVQISRKGDGVVLATLNAASEQDRFKFVMDLQESIFEMDVMERAIRDANMIK
jgi:IQ motif/SEC7 domain-containing protein